MARYVRHWKIKVVRDRRDNESRRRRMCLYREVLISGRFAQTGYAFGKLVNEDGIYV